MVAAPTPYLEFNAELAGWVGEVFENHPAELHDHRSEFPWLTGCLGDPKSPVWFVCEYLSLTQVERVHVPQPESQWSVSPGDLLFRRMLAETGFKAGGDLASGGWRCYITNVVKSTQRAGEWDKLPPGKRNRMAEIWAPVLSHELDFGSPELLVALGRSTEGHLDQLQTLGFVKTRAMRRTIDHYTYVASHPRKGMPPNDPRRIEQYRKDFLALRSLVPDRAS